jgi:hypothetical protein
MIELFPWYTTPTLLQNQKSLPSMDGNGTPESVIFADVGLFFHAYRKLILWHVFPRLFLTG